jgi:hypothetical protein
MQKKERKKTRNKYKLQKIDKKNDEKIPRRYFL